MVRIRKTYIVEVKRLILALLITSVALSCKENRTRDGEPKNVLELKGEDVEMDESIWVIFQDTMGNYWFGSRDEGLFQYDGESLIQFTKKDGLAHNSIRGIEEDREGNMLIETPAGVSKYDGTSFTPITPIISDSNEWRLEPDDLWFSCNGNSNDVFRYDGTNLYQLKLPRKDLEAAFGIDPEGLSYNAYAVYGIDKDNEGNIWFGTVLAGAYRYDGASFLWIGEKELSRQDDGREPGIRSILQEENGTIWLSNFISRFRIDRDQYEKFKGIDLSKEQSNTNVQFFNSGISDLNGNLWMTTYSSGVWRYDGKRFTNYKVAGKQESISLITIYQDKNGTIWLGTDNDGVYRFNGEGFVKFEFKLKQ